MLISKSVIKGYITTILFLYLTFSAHFVTNDVLSYLLLIIGSLLLVSFLFRVFYFSSVRRTIQLTFKKSISVQEANSKKHNNGHYIHSFFNAFVLTVLMSFIVISALDIKETFGFLPLLFLALSIMVGAIRKHSNDMHFMRNNYDDMQQMGITTRINK
ncbi:hypothetical protein [Pontibacillus halophilus]|uniref:hypothetical protein n=1 Tax=Pontibacillus halophilus TaxID=516704 RepID=UPI00047CD538|nr:hypothetical protein [Pontibacillus halophilus]